MARFLMSKVNSTMILGLTAMALAVPKFYGSASHGGFNRNLQYRQATLTDWNGGVLDLFMNSMGVGSGQANSHAKPAFDRAVNNGFAQVALDGDKIVGFCFGTMDNGLEREVSMFSRPIRPVLNQLGNNGFKIFAIGVDSNYRGSAIGRHLVDAAEQYATISGASHVWLGSQANLGAAPFWERLEYARVGDGGVLFFAKSFGGAIQNVPQNVNRQPAPRPAQPRSGITGPMPSAKPSSRARSRGRGGFRRR